MQDVLGRDTLPIRWQGTGSRAILGLSTDTLVLGLYLQVDVIKGPPHLRSSRILA